MTSEGSERVERREECKEHVDDDEFRQQMRELVEEVKEQINREEAKGGVESGEANEERDAKAERESTDIDEGSEGDDEFQREMQELIAEVREISERNESEESDEFRKQMRELIDEVERELDADERSADSAEDRLDEFEENILENFEKYGIDGDEVRERWRERFVEDVEEGLEKDSASDEIDESTNASDDAASSEVIDTAESYSYSESDDGTVQVLKTEGSSETTESVNESEEHKAEMEPQSEADLSVEGEKDSAVEESNQKEDLESPKAEKQSEKQITHETESETSESSTQHELNRNSKERSPETSENAQTRQQTSETVLELSEEKAEAAERKNAQDENIETHSARAECEELAEEEVEETRIEGHLNESDDEEVEVTRDSGSEHMQEWKEDGESEELAESEHLEEPDSTQSTLESYEEVLEENISPDAEELDEDEEVDEQVGSDDKGLTGMIDSPYPRVYVDETGFFAETEEQRWRRKLIELYNELPEEMKQLYRELVKAMLESEGGLEKLLDTFSELREYEDFEEEHEDAIKYVKFMQKIRELKLLGTLEETTAEKLALELDIDQETAEKWLNDDYDSFPKIIQQVWSQEIERRWGNVLRAIANRDMPYDMSEVNEILKRFPELKRKRRFGWHYDEVRAWTEVMAAKRQGKIATLIIQGKERFKLEEVKELARRLNRTEDKVVRWLREESSPRLVDMLTEKRQEGRLKRNGANAVKEKGATDADSSATGTRRKNPNPRTWKEYEEALKYHPKLRMKKSFDKAQSEVRVFCTLQEMLQRGDVDLSGFAEEHGLSLSRAFDWSREESLPKLLKLLRNLELRRLFERSNGGPPEVPIKSMGDVKRLLQKYPDLQQDSYENCEKYFEVKDDYSMPLRELAKIYGVSKNKIGGWKRGKEPRLIARLRRYEEDRILRGWAEIESSKSHQELGEIRSTEMDPREKLEGPCRIPQTKAREILSKSESEAWTHENLTDAIEQICRNLPKSSNRVFYTDLRNDVGLTLTQIESLRNLLQINRDLVIQALKERLCLQANDESLRLGLVDDRLYVWTPDSSPMKLINAYREQYFYFGDRNEAARFIAEMKEALEGIEEGGLHDTKKYLEKLISQMFPESKTVSIINEKGKQHRILGNHLHFLIDMSSRSIADLEGRILKVSSPSGHGGIINPKFPEGEKLEVAVARLTATVASDGRIGSNGVIMYWESEIERIKRVEHNLREFGDIRLKPCWIESDNTYICYFPSVLGKALQHLGLTSGDKTVQNPALHPSILESSWRALCAFIEDLIPEDGSVMPGRIWWTHSNALHPGEKCKMYDVLPFVGQEEISFIKRFGKPEAGSWRLAMGELGKQKRSMSSEIAQLAERLYDIVFQNPNRLIMSEKRIVENLGIKVRCVPASVFYHGKTGRVSVAWVIHTASADEAMKLAMIAPPNDVKKKGILKDWLRSIPEDVKRVQAELVRSGIEAEKWWID